MGDGYQAQAYPDSQNLFALGRAAIYPAGSWDISLFNQQAEFKMGAFYPPVKKAGDTCYISDHVDIALGMNAKSAHPEETKKFLEWVASPDFATIYANSLPGFFSLSDQPVKLEDPIATEFVELAQGLQDHDPVDLPGAVARHAQPRERDLGRVRQRAQRQRDPGTGWRAPAEGPRQLVQARAVSAGLTSLPCSDRPLRRPIGRRARCKAFQYNPRHPKAWPWDPRVQPREAAEWKYEQRRAR